MMASLFALHVTPEPAVKKAHMMQPQKLGSCLKFGHLSLKLWDTVVHTVIKPHPLSLM